MDYSLNFRKRVLAYKDKHSPAFEQTSTHFDISIRILFRWSYKIGPCITRDKPPTKIHDEALITDVQNYPDDYHYPDDYQWERAKRLEVSQSAVHYALKQLNINVKKTLKSPKSDPQIHQVYRAYQ